MARTGIVFFLGFRYLLGRAREGGRYLRGAAAGIALSLVPIIITLLVADGMIRGITERYLELGTGHIQVYPYLGVELDAAQLSIETVEGIRGVWRERHGMGVIVGKKGKVGSGIRATDPSFWQDSGSQRYLESIAGSTLLESDQEVLLGQSLAQTIGAEPGDTIRVMTIQITNDGRNVPKLTPFTVKGIVSSGYRELDSLWCIMSYEAGEAILPERMSTTYLMIKINEPYTLADSTANYLSTWLGLDYDVYTWKEVQRSQYAAYESTRQLLLFIMALIVMIAAVNVASATSMLVIERSRDIAILKAAGMSPKSTEHIFIWASFLTGVLGAVLGIAAGLILGRFVNGILSALEIIINVVTSLFRSGEQIRLLDPGFYLERIPIIIDWTAVLLIGIFTVLCSVLASWIPARNAGKLRPIETLRKY